MKYLKYLQAVWPPLALFFLGMGCFLLSSGVVLAVLSLLFATVMIFDVIGRGRCYHKLVHSEINQIRYVGVWRRYKGSFCSRNVVTTVFPSAKGYYRNAGYRWYHIFPDGTFTKKSTLFKLSFWKELINP